MHSSSPRGEMRAGGTAGPGGLQGGGTEPRRDGPLSGMPAALTGTRRRWLPFVHGTKNNSQRLPSLSRSGKEPERETSLGRDGQRVPVVLGPLPPAQERAAPANGTSLARPAGASRGAVGTLMSPQADLPCHDAGLRPSRRSGIPTSKISGIRRGKTPGTFPNKSGLWGWTTGSGLTRCPQLLDLVPAICPGYLFSTVWIASTPKVCGHLEELCLVSAFLSESGRKAEYQFTYSLPILSSTQTPLPDAKTKPCSPIFLPPQGCRWPPSLSWIWGEKESFWCGAVVGENPGLWWFWGAPALQTPLPACSCAGTKWIWGM